MNLKSNIKNVKYSSMAIMVVLLLNFTYCYESHLENCISFQISETKSNEKIKIEIVNVCSKPIDIDTLLRIGYKGDSDISIYFNLYDNKNKIINNDSHKVHYQYLVLENTLIPLKQNDVFIKEVEFSLFYKATENVKYIEANYFHKGKWVLSNKIKIKK